MGGVTLEHNLKQMLTGLLVFCSVFLFASSSFAKPLQPITVQVNWNHQYQFAGFYAAIQQGYYQQAGLDVTVKSWQPGMTLVNEVLSGRAQFSTGYSSTLVDYAKGHPIQLVMASFQYSPMVLLSHTPVNALSDLSGKRVMHWGNLQITGLIEKVNSLSGRPVQEIPSSGDLQDFIDKKIDFYGAYETNEPYRLQREGVPFHIVDPKRFGIQSYGDLVFTSAEWAAKHPVIVNGFKAATVKGWEYAVNHPEEVVDYILANYEVVKTREALLHEAKETVKYVQSGSLTIGQMAQEKLMVTAVQAKEVGMITEEELQQADWDSLVFKALSIELTEAEQQYLADNPVWKVGNDHNWPPFDFINEQGEYDGIIADYMKWVGKTLNVELETLKNRPWHQILDDMKQGRLHVAPGAMSTPERQSYLDFTRPYMSFPLVLMARQDVGYINDLGQLAGERVAVPKGWYTEELLNTKYPEVEVVSVASVTHGLKAVIEHQAEFYLGNLAAINYQLKQHNFTGLKAVGTVDESKFLLTMAVTEGNDALLSILQKALDVMPEAEKKRIYDRWVNLQVVKETDHTVLYRWLFIGGFTILILLIGMWALNRQKQRQQAYIDNINELSFASHTLMAGKEIDWVSHSFAELTRYRRDELIGQCHDILRHPSVDSSVYDTIWAKLEAGEIWKGELLATRKDGTDYWVEAVATPEIKHGKVVGVWITRTDITSRKRLEQMVIKDALTGAYNRHHFNETFDVQLNRANRHHDAFALAIFDIDFFKEVNDFYGHQKGDEVLKQVVNVVQQNLHRAGDRLFRVGGEEFVILTDIRDETEFFQYLEHLREAVEELGIENPRAKIKTLTISIGGLFCARTGKQKSETLYSMMDRALYDAKHQGRNQVVMRVMEDCVGQLDNKPSTVKDNKK